MHAKIISYAFFFIFTYNLLGMADSLHMKTYGSLKHPNFQLQPSNEAKKLITHIQKWGGAKHFTDPENYLESIKSHPGRGTDSQFFDRLSFFRHALLALNQTNTLGDQIAKTALSDQVIIEALLNLTNNQNELLNVLLVNVALQNNIEKMQLFHQSGANLDYGRILYYACIGCSEQVIIYVLDHCSYPLTIQVFAEARETLNHNRKRYSVDKLVRIEALLTQLEQKLEPLRKTKLECAKKLIFDKNLSEIETFFTLNSAFLNEKDENGITPLLYAAQLGNLEIAILLHELGATYSILDGNKHPADVARECGHIEFTYAYYNYLGSLLDRLPTDTDSDESESSGE